MVRRLARALRRAALVLPAVASLLACRSVPPPEPGPERIGRAERAAARASGPYEIARWFHFRRAAFTLSFDDGTLDQYLLAWPELEARGLKATFFVITEPRSRGVWFDGATARLLFGWGQARELARAGHEIASHSATHADLRANPAAVEGEVLASLAALTEQVGSAGALSFAWPYWRPPSATPAGTAARILAARSGTASVETYLERGVPSGSAGESALLDVNALAALATASDEEWAAVAAYVLQRGGWLVVNFHGIDDGAIERRALGWEPLPLDRLRALLDWLVAEQGFWVAPFGRVVRYIRERERALLVRETVRGAGVLVYRLLDGLDDHLYDQALTVRVPLPEGWAAARVTQGELEMPSRAREGWLEFDALPDGRPIRIERP